MRPPPWTAAIKCIAESRSSTAVLTRAARCRPVMRVTVTPGESGIRRGMPCSLDMIAASEVIKRRLHTMHLAC